MANAVEISEFLSNKDHLGEQIATKFQVWDNMRQSWLSQKQEIQQYIFATSTNGTTNASLPWKNRIHIPKLCQIRDNLHANYMATLFPNDDAIVWEGDDTDDETLEKRKVIQSYLQNKMKQSNFRNEVSKLIYDYIDYGNVFAVPVFVAEYTDDPITGEKIPNYVGPKIQRVNPVDIVFDPTAVDFVTSPKIIRRFVSLATLKSEIESKPELGYLSEVFDKIMENRHRFAASSRGDFIKNDLYQISGFSGYWDYMVSDTVEILDFYGDIYDREKDQLYKNHLISVVDRCLTLRNQASDNWLGRPPIHHAGWRIRQDNLYAMGPLDNLVGMQHRIDHLENAKSDAFDLIIHPVQKITGLVEDYEYGPGERIYCGDDGNVEFMHPDTTFLAADTQIEMIEAKMEEMAGAPKQAMGFRTPGEKTAYEVQVLENGANRVFYNKISHFEEVFLEPILNDMLELARRNLNDNDIIRVMDDETQAVTFEKITKEDITARGKIRPIGARHFAQNAQIVQNMTQFAQSALGQNPNIMAHFSGRRVAQALEHLLGLEKFKIYQPNIGLYEQAEMQQIAASLQQTSLEEQTVGMDPNQAALATQQAMQAQQ